MIRKRKISKYVKRKLDAGVMAGRRETIYKYIALDNEGNCPCFVCDRHVREENATLEHILPHSLGGSDDIENLSISHYQCNQARLSDIGFTRKKNLEEIVQEFDDRTVSFKIIG